MGRFFNTAGPCRPEWHYMLPAAERLPEVPWLVDRFGYFVVHAPRQTGKTTTLRAIASELTASGRYAALVASCEVARAAGKDYVAAQVALLDSIRQRAEMTLPVELRPPDWPVEVVETSLSAGLAGWTRSCPLPVVLFLDEIDSLAGQSLVTVLSQLRTGYDDRPEDFPRQWDCAGSGMSGTIRPLLAGIRRGCCRHRRSISN